MMKVLDMKPFVAYRVTKGSSDKTFITGEIMWLSKNGIIRSQDGVLNPDEWSPETIDFEIEKDPEYSIDRIGDRECLYKRDKNAGCDCCNGDTPLYWDGENSAYILSKGEMHVMAGRFIKFPVKYCPSCGKKF